MRIVVALGGNALQKRGEKMTTQSQRDNVRLACQLIAPLARDNELVVTHGNGPQVGLLALQAAAYNEESQYPFDVLGACTEGMLGYLIDQELGNQLGLGRPVATLMSQTEVSPDDPAFEDPTKFVGPVYTELEAQRHAEAEGWTVRPDGQYWRRVVPSPRPVRVLETPAIQQLLEGGNVVICAGGGGVPVVPIGDEQHRGVEAVIDKDFAAAVLARDLGADRLFIATDAPGVFVDWGTPQQRQIRTASPAALEAYAFPAGSMGPKVEAAKQFATETGKTAVIGSLEDLTEMVEGTAGTRISNDADGIDFR